MRLILFLLVLAAAAAAGLFYFGPKGYEEILTLPTDRTAADHVDVGDPAAESTIICPLGVEFTGADTVALVDRESNRILDLNVRAAGFIAATPLPLPAGYGPDAMAYENGALWLWVTHATSEASAPIALARRENGGFTTSSTDRGFSDNPEAVRRLADLGFGGFPGQRFGSSERPVAEEDEAKTDWLWTETAFAPNGAAFVAAIEISGGRFSVRLDGPNGAGAAFDATSGRDILTANVLKATDAGDVFIAVQSYDASSARIDVHETIYRLRADGSKPLAYDVPLHGVDCVAKQRASVSDDGDIVALRVDENAARVIRLTPRTRWTQLNALLHEPRTVDLRRGLMQAWNEVLGAAYAQEMQEPVAKTLTRDKVVANACKYLKHSWAPTAASINPAGLCACDATDAACARKQWAKPAPKLDVTAGDALVALPYNWGGGDLLADFDVKIAAGAPAGNVCTKNSIPNVTAGVDCSGFVTRAWGYPKATKYGTVNIAENSVTQGVTWERLRPGDALNSAGNHVVVVLYKIKPAVAGKKPDSIRVVESTKWKKCGGVCATSLQLAELDRSKPVQLWEAVYNSVRPQSAMGSGYQMRRSKAVVEPASPLTPEQVMCWR